MAHTRRKSNGCRRGKFKPKKMGKGWSSYRDALGFRPPVKPKKTAEAADKKSGDAE